MDKQKKIEEIRKACIAVNPEIVELKFGCVVKQVDTFTIVGGENHSLIVLNNETRKIYDSLLIGPNWRIIGRPIRLADVLLAIGKKSGIDVKWRHEKVIETYMRWDLLKDSLEEQSEECISFIYELIQK